MDYENNIPGDKQSADIAIKAIKQAYGGLIESIRKFDHDNAFHVLGHIHSELDKLDVLYPHLKD